jgi:hypothetical protein
MMMQARRRVTGIPSPEIDTRDISIQANLLAFPQIGVTVVVGVGGEDFSSKIFLTVSQTLEILQSSNGKVLVKCHAGCSQDRVISTLRERGLWPPCNGNPAKPRGLTLQELADAKHLPVDSLKKWGVAGIDYKGQPAVYIPYRDLEGKTTDRFRLNLKQEPRLLWRKGSKTLL